MIVLGIDPGSLATGFGVIETVPVLHKLDGGVVRTAPGATLAERLLTIHSAIAEVVRRCRPGAVAVENVFSARNARSSLVLGHARGVAMLAAAEAGLAVAEYAPREIKQAVTGNGAATKQQVRFMVMKLLGLKEAPPFDESDALAVALAHAGRATSAAQRARAGGGR